MAIGQNGSRRLCVRSESGRRMQAALIGSVAAMGCGAAQAGSFGVFGLDGEYQLSATYSAAVRTEKPAAGIIDPPPSAEIPVPDDLKVSQYNYDDGDRNFNQWAPINNRLTLLGEVQFTHDDYGLLLRGDAFYDRVYRKENDNDSPDTINKSEGAVNEFTDNARYRSGRRARVLDAYVYGSWYLGDSAALNLRIGRHIAAWGESLFFNGIALAQSPADATKATVPGADVKSILLPVNQISAQMSVTDKITLLGQYKLEYEETELNPVGEFFSVADVVGPGAEFIYGLENPLYLANLADINLLSGQLAEYVALLGEFFGVPLPVTGPLGDFLDALDPLLPDVNLPAIPTPNSPRYINVQRAEDIKPSDFGQWGLGVKYQLTPVTNVGLYHLRYHNTTPAPVQNYGYAPLIGGENGTPVLLTTQALGLLVPTTYNIRYFDGIHMTAMSLSTSLFGANVGADVTYRDGLDVLVDVDGGLLGPVPTPVRSKVGQIQISALYTLGPRWFWDSATAVVEAGYNKVFENDSACGPTSCSSNLTYDSDASAIQTLFIIDKKNVFPAWDVSFPIVLGTTINGQSSFLSAFGSLMGPGDYRASAGVNFTRLQALQLGVTYSAYIGDANYEKRPYQDRDNLAFSVKYNF